MVFLVPVGFILEPTTSLTKAQARPSPNPQAKPVLLFTLSQCCAILKTCLKNKILNTIMQHLHSIIIRDFNTTKAQTAGSNPVFFCANKKNGGRQALSKLEKTFHVGTQNSARCDYSVSYFMRKIGFAFHPFIKRSALK